MAKNMLSAGRVPAVKTREMRQLTQVGTKPATTSNIQGYGLTSGKHGWGGARNRALRESQFLTLEQCQSLTAAAERSQQIGLPFNRHWTVHYENAGIAEADATAFIRRLLKLLGDYARRHGAQLAAVWCRENGKGKGGHVHIVLHLPADLSLMGKTRRWVRIAGGQCRKGVSVVRSIAGSLTAAKGGSDHYLCNVAIVRAYLIKGASIAVGEMLRLTLFGQGGLIVGKRCGWTQNIGSAARQGMCQSRDKSA